MDVVVGCAELVRDPGLASLTSASFHLAALDMLSFSIQVSLCYQHVHICLDQNLEIE
jgi:hypothetical protein